MINTDALMEHLKPSNFEAITGPAKLTIQDRCDGCSAQALYRVEFPFAGPNILDFCGHHHNKYLIRILELGGLVIDSVTLGEGPPGVGI